MGNSQPEPVRPSNEPQEGSKKLSSSFPFLPPTMAARAVVRESDPGPSSPVPEVQIPPRSKKLSSSLDSLPPNMSELRVVLLGNSWSERTSVGNFILGETKFNTDEEPDNCVRVRGQLKDKEIVLVNTPDLLHPNVSGHKQKEIIENCVSLSEPGPHVFLLVLQPEDFTEEQKQSICGVLQSLSDQSFDHSLILISTPRDESSGFMEMYRQHPPLKDMIQNCKYRFLWRKDLELPELLTRLDQVVKENI